MKAFSLVLLCFVAASQARSTGSNDVKWTPAESGAAPWLVHLRIAVWNSGLLNTCAGSIIDQRWLLTSASCVTGSRFVWSRYGAREVIRPALVLETSATDVNVIAHPNYDAATGANNVALISINRNVEFSSNIVAPVLAAADSEVPSSGNFCAFGQSDSDGPGEELRCINVALESGDGVVVASSDDGEASNFDLGAPLVVDGVQYGILVDPASGTFLNPANYREWIEQTAGISLPEPEEESSEENGETSEEDGETSEEDGETSEEDSEPSEEDSEPSEEEEVDAVKFVN